jgi:hypothetical protein
MARKGHSNGCDLELNANYVFCLHSATLNEKPNLFLTRQRAALDLDYCKGGPERKERPMLPPFIIEQIRKREEDERRRHGRDQPRLELPLDVHRPAAPREEKNDSEVTERGVIILDLLGDG